MSNCQNIVKGGKCVIMDENRWDSTVTCHETRGKNNKNQKTKIKIKNFFIIINNYNLKKVLLLHFEKSENDHRRNNFIRFERPTAIGC